MKRAFTYLESLDTTIQPDTKGNAPECAPGDEMITLIPHPTHEPMPMAMVCRKPWGGKAESAGGPWIYIANSK